MQKLNKHETRIAIAAVLLVLTAMACRLSSKNSDSPFLLFCGQYVRTAIYIGLFSAWGVSLRRRIVQQQARRYLTAIASLMVFWISIRTVKYLFVTDPTVLRQLWYLFYLPMLFIPLLALFIANSLGKPEDFRLPKWTAILFIPTVAFLLLVLTNDLHRWVFTFPADIPIWSDRNHGYTAGYFLVIGWMLLCAMFALIAMFKKCRVPHSRTVLFLPLIPMICTLFYAVLYVLRFPPLQRLMGDITVSYCVLFSATLECCIQCGLIPYNARYGELFRASTIAAQITDEAYGVFLSSDTAVCIPADTMRASETTPAILSDGTRLMNAPIANGHVLWQEDMSQLLAAQVMLQETNDKLERQNEQLRQKYKEEKLRLQVEETNRLYDAMERGTENQLRLMTDLLQRLPEVREEGQMRQMLCRIAIIGAYLKRRNNLIFVASQQGCISENELAGCLNESARGIALGGGRCMVQCETAKHLPPNCAMRIYDFFEEVVETAGPTASFYVTVTAETDAHVVAISTVCDSGFLSLAEKYPDAEVQMDDENTWSLVLRVGEEVSAG